MDRQLFAHDPDFGYRFIPGLKLRINFETGGYLLRTNEQGFRSNHQFTPEVAPGKARVLLLGDSLTHGTGINVRDRFGERIEQAIPDLEVFNFGMPGTGTDQHLLIYRKFKDELQHDLVVVGLWVENIARVVSRYRFARTHAGELRCVPKPFFLADGDGDGLTLGGVPVPSEQVPLEDLPKEMRRHVAGLPFSERVKGHPEEYAKRVIAAGSTRVGYRRSIPEAYRRRTTSGWKVLSGILRAWSAEAPVPVLVVLLPMPLHILGQASSKKYQRRFQELASETDLAIYDPLPEIVQQPLEARRGFHFERDGHPTAAYNHLLGSLLAPQVRALLPVGKA